MIPVQTLRQISIITGLTLCSISDGYIFGQMSGMISALRHDKTIGITEDDISLIASVINITIFMGVASLSFLTEKYGRKKLVNYLSVFIIIHWLLVYYAHDKTTILISRIIGGLPFGGILLITYVSVGEYVSPNIRPLAMNVVASVGQSLGTASGHILCTVMHWRNVALLGIIPTIVSAILPYFWVESPFWLATKGRFEECEQAFRALRVTTEASEKELKTLVESQTHNLVNNGKYNGFVEVIVKYLRLCKEKRFWRATALILVVGIYRVFGGKILMNTLALSMLEDITGTNNILHYTLVVDGFVILGSSLSCLLISRFKIRPLLFISGLISNCVQIIFAACFYFWPTNDNFIAWVKTLLLALYFITVIAGPYAVLDLLMLELMPLDGKTIQIIIASAIFGVLQFYHVKISMKMIPLIGYQGVFLTDAIVIFFCLLYFYFCLPETRNRTLQEIEFYFINNSFATDAPKNIAEEERLFKVNEEKVAANVSFSKINEK